MKHYYEFKEQKNGNLLLIVQQENISGQRKKSVIIREHYWVIKELKDRKHIS